MAHPNLNGIRTFVYAARLGSFSAAADVLSVTQGAISQQIARLEGYLGARLFERQAGGLKLTAHGQRLFFAIAQQVDQIDIAVGGMREGKQLKTLVLATLNSFAAQWLIPRLTSFEATHPEIRIQLETSTETVDVRAGGADAAIRCGRGDWPGLHIEQLFREEMFAVATPAYAASLPHVKVPADIVELPLLFDLDERTEWLDWFSQAGIEQPPNLFYGYSDSLVMLSALKHGKQGIALAQQFLVEEELKQGELVRLFPHSVPSRNAYFIATASPPVPGSPLATFHQWLLTQAREHAERLPDQAH